MNATVVVTGRSTGRAEERPWVDAGQLNHRKYQYMESNMQRRAAGLKDKLPDIQKTLETVRFLKTRTVRHPGLLPACTSCRGAWGSMVGASG